MNGIEFKKFFETHFPLNYAYDWDNVGLQVGTLNKELTNILVTLDLTKEVLQEAIDKNCNLIVIHHPVIFRPMKKILSDTYQGQLITKAIKNDIALYVAHTNFDISNKGMNHNLASLLGLENQQILEYTDDEVGLGRIGTVPEQSLESFINHVKTTLNLDSVKLIGKHKKRVKTVGISGGSGGSMLHNKALRSIDVFLTGDISYHQALDALNDNLTILDIGHNIEKYGLIDLVSLLNDSLTTNVILSEIETNPYQSK